MHFSNRLYFFAFGALIPFLGILWPFSGENIEEKTDVLPLKGQNYEGSAIPFKPEEKALLKESPMLKRKYSVLGTEFFVTIIGGKASYYTGDHDPKACFLESGWKIVSEHPLPLNKGEASLLEIQKDGQKREVLFWFSIDGTQYTSPPTNAWLSNALETATFGFIRFRSKPLLIVVQPLEEKQVDWFKFRKNFPELFEI